MGLFLSLFHPSDMFQKSVRCYLIMGAFLIWVPYGGFLWERFLLVGSFGKGVFWKRVLWKGNLIVGPKRVLSEDQVYYYLHSKREILIIRDHVASENL